MFIWIIIIFYISGINFLSWLFFRDISGICKIKIINFDCVLDKKLIIWVKLDLFFGL